MKKFLIIILMSSFYSNQNVNASPPKEETSTIQFFQKFCPNLSENQKIAICRFITLQSPNKKVSEILKENRIEFEGIIETQLDEKKFNTLVDLYFEPSKIKQVKNFFKRNGLPVLILSALSVLCFAEYLTNPSFYCFGDICQ